MRKIWGAAGMAAFALTVSACASSGAGGTAGGVPAVNASVSSEAAAAGAAAKSALYTIQHDAGGKHIEDAAKQCEPLKGGELTTVVLISPKDVPKSQLFDYGKAWKNIVKYLTGPKGNRGANWQTFKDCLVNQLHFKDPNGKKVMTDCLGKSATSKFGNYPKSLSGIQQYVTKTFLGCYDLAAGLTPTPSASSSSTGNHSPPASPAATKTATATPTAS